MTSKERFESWAIENNHAFKTDDGKLMFVEGWPAGIAITEAWKEAERQALERAAALIEPKNDMDDWTDWARTRYEAAQQIRGLIEEPQ